MKSRRRLLTLILIATVFAEVGCNHAYSVGSSPAVGASAATPDPKKAIPLLVRINEAGEPLDENGAAITKEGIGAKLENGTLKRSTPVRISVKGTQKKGVLETSEMFVSLGFSSVAIELILQDPLK